MDGADLRKLKEKTVDTAADVVSLMMLFVIVSPRRSKRILELGRRPIVIGGCGRSGTTLMLSVLSCHPHILAVEKETTALCPDGYSRAGYVKNPRLDAPLVLWRIYRSLVNLDISEEKTRWCEKTPRNVFYFEKILRRFGQGVRIIHMVRDGRDVVTSRHPLEKKKYWIGTDRWVQDVSAGLKTENHPQVLTVRYEDLVQDYQKTVRRVCTFIGEEFVPDFASYPQNARVKQNLAWFGRARSMHTSPIGRWKEARYVQRVAAFLSEPGAVELLRHYGYEVE